MRRKKIDYNEVASAAERIKQNGLELTVTHLCLELGYSEVGVNILELLEEWCRNQRDFQQTLQISPSQTLNFETLLSLNLRENIESALQLTRATLDSITDGIVVVDNEWNIFDWNQTFMEMWRIPSDWNAIDHQERLWEHIYNQLNEPLTLISDAEERNKKNKCIGLSELFLKDGRVFERYITPRKLEENTAGRIYVFRDVTQKRMIEKSLRIREQAIAALGHGIVIIDIQKDNLPIMYYNQSFARMAGENTTDCEILGEGLFHIAGLQNELIYKQVSLAIWEERYDVMEFEWHRNGGEELFDCELSLSPIVDGFNRIQYYCCLFTDISNRQINNTKVIGLATHDVLTELPNRALLVDRFERAVLSLEADKEKIALLYLNMDYFKRINESYDYSVGDKLIQSIASRLLTSTDPCDSVARLENDEFMVIMPDLATEEEAEEKAKELITVLAKPFYINHHRIEVTVSIGISYYPRHGIEFETLLKNAQLSMYHAKEERNTWCVFTQEMNHKIICQMQLDASLRDAMRENEFYLVYQPLMDLRKNKVVGLEALIRWQSKILGNVPPLDFIHVAEENGLIIPIGQWVMDQACKQIAVWHQKGFKGLCIAVNISERQLYQEDFLSMIEDIIIKSGISPHCLELEISERLLLNNIKEKVLIMHKIKDLGVRLVIDDFGTGYSSLSYLKQIPVDKIKIDCSYVHEMNTPNGDAPIARAIIGFGHALNVPVLAEGIETELQRNFMTAHGCDYAQGFYFQAPVCAEEIEAFMMQYLNKNRQIL